MLIFCVVEAALLVRGLLRWSDLVPLILRATDDHAHQLFLVVRSGFHGLGQFKVLVGVMIGLFLLVQQNRTHLMGGLVESYLLCIVLGLHD